MFTTESKVKTSKGYPAKIITTEMNYNSNSIVILALIKATDHITDTICLFNINGEPLAHDYGNLVEIGQWDNFEIDDPVVATINLGNGPYFENAHFAGIRENATTGKQTPMIFIDGHTGWTSDTTVDVLDCRRPIKEEIELYKNRTGLNISTEEQLNSTSYLGTWDPATNTPPLYAGQGIKYQYYKVIPNGIDWHTGDVIQYNGKEWAKNL